MKLFIINKLYFKIKYYKVNKNTLYVHFPANQIKIIVNL